MNSWKRASVVTLASSLVALVACGSTNNSEFGSSSGDTTGSSGSSGGFEGTSSGSSGSSGGTECAAHEAQASLTKKPVDIIFVIDNSGSMSDEIKEVEKQINENFATIIEASGIDYRVIMLASHGASGSQKVCVKAPLSGTSCSPIPAQPVETAKFKHHSRKISSTDAWCRVLDHFDLDDEFGLHPQGFKTSLRKEAFKVFAVISDDRSSCSFNGKSYNDSNTAVAGTNAAAAFDADLLALSPEQFGTVEDRNYIWHSIIALAPFDAQDLALPHPPAAPITTTMCQPSPKAPATGHQALSILTGGLRYPTCGLEYTPIFQEMAKGVIEGARLSCEFPVPDPPPGETLDLATVVTTYTPGGGGAAVDFEQVADAAACAANKFYIESDTIKLCPATCDAVQKDGAAQIKVKFGCALKGAH
jgi:hypothetical protein